MAKPIIAITMRDPAAIGPEISVLATIDPTVEKSVHALIVGDRNRLEQAARILYDAERLSEMPTFQTINHVAEARFRPGTIPVLDLDNVPDDLP